MSHHAAKTVRFGRRQFDVLNEGPADRGESISVVKAERRNLVTTPADLNGFPQRQFAESCVLPKFLRGLVSIGGRLVQRVLFLAQTRIDGDNGFPGPILQPPPFHLALAEER